MTDVTDNFNRPDGGLGANWTVSSDLAAAGAGSLQIVSNAVQSVPQGNHFASYYSAASFSDDQFAQVVLTGSASAGGGAVVRHQGTARSSFYLFFVTIDGTCYYFRCDNGVFTQLGSTFGAVVGQGATIKLRISGSTLIASINGVDQPSRTDATYTSGFPGIESYNAILDSFDAGPIAVQNVGTANGIGAASAVGASIAASIGTADGIGAASASGTGVKLTVGNAIGAGSAAATGAGATASTGSAAATGAASAASLALLPAVGAAAGIGSAAATGTSLATIMAVGAAAGTGSARGVPLSAPIISVIHLQAWEPVVRLQVGSP